MSKIIDGQILAEKIKSNIAQEIIKLNARPNLAILLVGERADSELYVSLKEKEAKKVGIDTHLYKCEKNISELEILKIIKYLNKDELIDAILVQLPLPDNLNTDIIIKAIDPLKDVDGFHPDNLRILMDDCEHNKAMPPIFAVIFEMLKSIKCDLAGKNVAVIANSKIFGNSLTRALDCHGAKTTLCHYGDKKLINKISVADILITAVGKKNFIKKNMVKQDAVVIDIGITRQNGKVFGDVDFDDVKNKTSFIAPVPGGVGPMTIAMAFKNTLALYKKRRNQGIK
ncbi:MAG: bifunctional 5,10-methylenetetrahydrofolate dehydrogenase/5,10-methenyltetrahydrofolate cyclohydrolase [Patescibacteria group bacterium]